MTTFIFPNDLLVIENKQEIILRKGVLHKHEIIIDKSLCQNKNIHLSEALEN
ncbi:hypothetical protein L3V65_00545 [Heyndrickxia coagulans]|uniref:hypothetical protein n=1 Tax=Heyndrickxia coagulans TaxID=1398 RepID=UPI001F27DAA4|nr:hypothetical protein [Heyndrickxia coagulans]MED4344080.1 hypothetical protein [Heyndrickxia coagulans]UJZ87584.1 hypothetical protein L3V65_00545 [Heyndrickxia coagulans]